eukprot:gb/GECG01003197.1/.p1 GENE.gb/GECG01003197.1/~~gb/GECG01003197.1/.p1  ORF type:complete len:139 (+),score=14.77 gb/GECG01003197.1/:1-417(+)
MLASLFAASVKRQTHVCYPGQHSMKWRPQLRSFAARVALTHSTYIQGLLPFLDTIKHVDGIFALHPGEIRSCKAHYEKFSVKVSIPQENGYKCIVRKGRTMQDLYVVTELEKDELQDTMNEFAAKDKKQRRKVKMANS